MREVLWEFVCNMPWRMAAVINLVFLVLLAFSLLIVESGTPSYVIAVLSLALVLFALVVSALVLYNCQRVEELQ